MIKPFVKIERRNDAPGLLSASTYKHISMCRIFGNGYILAIKLSIEIPRILVPAANMLSIDYEDRPDLSMRYVEFELSMNGNMMADEKSTIEDLEAIQETKIKEKFLDWIDAFQSTINESIDVTAILSKVIKWYNTWENEQIIKDIIE